MAFQRDGDLSARYSHGFAIQAHSGFRMMQPARLGGSNHGTRAHPSEITVTMLH